MFGTAAAVTARSLGMSTVVIDPRPDCLIGSSHGVEVTTLPEVDPKRTGEIQLVIGGSVDGLLRLCETRVPDIVVPAMGGHFAARVAVAFGKQKGADLMPCPSLLDRVVQRFPKEKVLSCDAGNAMLVASMMPAGGMCELDCSQPRKCPVTGQNRTVPMHDLIRAAVAEEADRFTVLRTRTLGTTGVIAGADLLGMFKQLKEFGKKDTFAVATSCKCHGIVNFLMPAQS